MYSYSMTNFPADSLSSKEHYFFTLNYLVKHIMVNLTNFSSVTQMILAPFEMSNLL